MTSLLFPHNPPAWLLRLRIPLIGATHAAVAAAALLLSFFIRANFDLAGFGQHYSIIIQLLPVAVLIKLVSLRYFDLHRGLWKYVSTNDLAQILKACTASTLFLALFVYLLHWEGVPRGVYLLDWTYSVMGFGGIRLTARLLRELRPRSAGDSGRRVLVVGAGDTGETALRTLLRSRDSAVVGFLDDDPGKHALTLHGLPVLGTLADAPWLIQKHGITTVVLAIPNADKKTVRHLVESCSTLKVKFQLQPLLQEISGKPSFDRLRDLKLEDLLGRDPIQLDRTPVAASLKDKTVLVTGAGGSIGSELARQIAGYGPRQLVLLDVGETPLFEIDRELRFNHPDLPIAAVFCDIKNAGKVDQTIETYRPDVIYHAAAYKHVPLMEAHPTDAVLNNVRGTHHLAEAARRHGVPKFLMISTDKAVTPRSVMGSTKRCAELLLSTLGRNGTAFVAVRFGNVLGSNGSVVPIFQKQIAQGGPVTVTHPDVTRYFMTIPEAVELVLQASAIGKDGDLFMLEMGQPVKIVALAKNMIELAGFTPGEEIAIEFTGLRPGEKLHEELAYKDEDVVPTGVPKLLLHKGRPGQPPPAELGAAIARLETLAAAGNEPEALALLRRIVGHNPATNTGKIPPFKSLAATTSKSA
ncbi:MAG: nucleoside-diphosphate sugar epimerase/dehydratase [Lentisphaeria bacterium]|jgi:FlaA1/EpsC-like NDP-sugar epimerase